MVNAIDLELMRLIDQEFMEHPFYGSRKMRWVLGKKGHQVNRKHVQRLMRQMGVEAIYPKPNLSRQGEISKRYPYLLRDMKIIRPGQVWSTDITYIHLQTGFLYLVAVMDWFSRYVLSWELSNTLSLDFCLEALERALKIGVPEIFNSDQGCQFTSMEFVSALEKSGAQISWDGRGRALDNVFIERLWRSLKYEEVYPKSYSEGKEAWRGIKGYFDYYNKERPHQSLGYKTPYEIHFGK